MNNSESNLSPNYVSINLPFWDMVPGCLKGSCFFVMYLLPVDVRYSTLYFIRVTDIDMVYTNIGFTCV